MRIAGLPGAQSDAAQWEGGQELSPQMRAAMVSKAYAAVRQMSADTLATQRLQEQQQAQEKTGFQNQVTTALNSAASTGKVDTTLLPSDFSKYGLRYDEYIKQATVAANDFKEFGDASQFPSQDAYLQHRLQVSAMAGANPGPVKNETDLDAGFRTTIGGEGRGRERRPAGQQARRARGVAAAPRHGAAGAAASPRAPARRPAGR